MGPIGTQSTPGMDRVTDRICGLAAAGDTRSYPNGTTFIASDIPDFAETLRRDLLRGGPIVIVYPDGRERFIRPIDPNGPRSIAARLLRRKRLR